MAISRSQMARQLYQIGGLSSLYNIGSEGKKPIYPRISDIESSLSNAEKKIGDPSLNSFGETSNGGFASPIAGVYSQFNEGRQLGGIGGGEMNSFNSTPFPGRQLGGTQSPALSFEGVGDPRLGAAIIPGNQLQMMMRGGAADGGLMNRQLYQAGGISTLIQDRVQMLAEKLNIPVEEAMRILMNLETPTSENVEIMSPEDTEVMEMLMLKQQRPEYQYDEENMYEGPRDMRAEGGISNVEKAKNILEEKAPPGEFLAYINPEEAGILKLLGGAGMDINQTGIPSYFGGIGGFVKSAVKGVTSAVKGATKAVKSIASSDIGKAALLAAGGYYLGGGTFGGLAPKFGSTALGQSAFGRAIATPFQFAGTKLGGLFSKVPTSVLGMEVPISTGGGILGGLTKAAKTIGGSNLLSAGLGFLGGAATTMLTPEQIQTGMGQDPAATRAYLRQYYLNLNPEATEEEAEQYALEQTREYAAKGGIMGVPTGEPRENQQGVKELDYRQEGGFVPVGIKEKADDVPAMLSKNEFVFTADAVRGAGNGDVDKGAQKLYSVMKTLENGGTV